MPPLHEVDLLWRLGLAPDCQHGNRAVTVKLEVRGPGSLASLATALDEHGGVLQVSGAEDKRRDDA
jgi:hypothetical protein